MPRGRPKETKSDTDASEPKGKAGLGTDAGRKARSATSRAPKEEKDVSLGSKEATRTRRSNATKKPAAVAIRTAPKDSSTRADKAANKGGGANQIDIAAVKLEPERETIGYVILAWHRPHANMAAAN